MKFGPTAQSVRLATSARAIRPAKAASADAPSGVTIETLVNWLVVALQALAAAGRAETAPV